MSALSCWYDVRATQKNVMLIRCLHFSVKRHVDTMSALSCWYDVRATQKNVMLIRCLHCSVENHVNPVPAFMTLHWMTSPAEHFPFCYVTSYDTPALSSNVLYISPRETSVFNPFTAVLAAPSLEKWATEVPNLKPLRLFSLFAWARERTSTKTHSTESRFVIGRTSTKTHSTESRFVIGRTSTKTHRTESRFVIGPSNTLSAGVHVCTFQPGNVTGWGS